MKRHPIHVVVAKLKRGEKLYRKDYGYYEFEDGSRPGEGVIRALRNCGRIREVEHGSRINCTVEIEW